MISLLLMLVGIILTHLHRDQSGAYWLLADSSAESFNQRAYSVLLPDGRIYTRLDGVFGNFLMWTPDGSGLLFLGRQGIYRTDFMGDNFNLIIPANGDAYFINPVQIALSPDTQMILAKVPRTRKTSNLHLLAANGQPIEQLPIESNLEIPSAIWHDNQTIEYTTRDDDNFTTYRMNIHDHTPYVIPSDVMRLADDRTVIRQDGASEVILKRTGHDPVSISLPDQSYQIAAWLPGDWLILSHVENADTVEYWVSHISLQMPLQLVYAASSDEHITFHTTFDEINRFIYFTVISGTRGTLYRIDTSNGFHREVVLGGFQRTFLTPDAPDGVVRSPIENTLIWQSLNRQQMEYQMAHRDGTGIQTIYRSAGPANKLLTRFSPDERHLYISVLDARPLIVNRRFVVRIDLRTRHVETIPGENWELKGISKAVEYPARPEILAIIGALLLGGLMVIPRSFYSRLWTLSALI